MSLLKKIDALYHHARMSAPEGYEPYAIRLDSWLYKDLMTTVDLSRVVLSLGAPKQYMGMKVLIEGFNDGTSPHTLTVEMKQPGNEGRHMYFEYADIPTDAHNARISGTSGERSTSDDAEPAVKTTDEQS